MSNNTNSSILFDNSRHTCNKWVIRQPESGKTLGSISYASNNKIIWFNTGWFSALGSTIQKIRDTFGNKVTILCTSTNEDVAYRNLCDKFMLEEKQESSSDYVSWALEFCKKYNVSVFFPKMYSRQISARKEEFSKAGISVVCEDSSVMNLLSSKKKTYEHLRDTMPELIPNYRCCDTFDSFMQHYPEIQKMSKDRKVVIKYDKDEGASSFRVIDDSAFDWRNLGHTHENILSLHDAKTIIKNASDNNKLKELIIMEWMDDPEISVDCYKSRSGRLETVVRVKKTSRMKEIITSGYIYDTLMAYCSRIQKLFGLTEIFNIQFRWVNENLKLLEINTRISGGIHMGYPIGANIPCMLIADRLCWELKHMELRHSIVSQYESPVFIREV